LDEWQELVAELLLWRLNEVRFLARLRRAGSVQIYNCRGDPMGCPPFKISRDVATTQRNHKFSKDLFFLKTAILKFAVSEQPQKFRRKIFFSGISEAAQANFS
jgi:hypothetical protein